MDCAKVMIAINHLKTSSRTESAEHLGQGTPSRDADDEFQPDIALFNFSFTLNPYWQKR